MKLAPVGIGLLALLAGACGRPAEPSAEPVVVLAASSLKRPFDAMAGPPRAATPEARISYAGSQDLAAQIEAGAPADVFASAGRKYMDRLAQGGFVDPKEVRPFAGNWLAVAYRLGLEPPLTSVSDLGRPGLRLLMGDPQVPVGKLAADLLDWLERQEPGARDRIQRNVVSYDQSDLALLAKLRLGEVDAALVYKSDLADEPNLRLLEVPAESGCAQVYFIAPIKASKHPAAAAQFIGRVLSANPGQKALRDFGFGPPPAAEPAPRTGRGG